MTGDRRKAKGFDEQITDRIRENSRRTVGISDNRNAARQRANAKARVRRRERRTAAP